MRPELVIESAEASVAGVEAALLENGGGVVIAWGSLALPGVRLDAGIALAAVPAMVTRSPEFWIYWPGRRLLLENSFDGSLHLARVPQTAGGRRASTPHAGQPGGGPPGSPPTQPPAAAGAPSLLLGAGRPRTAENVGPPR
ncbi:hypothetical protein [Actinoplanes sp. NPDC048796]|uniref:hypothetical protein n=1 Tax=Actinoplanes sp. NPDC048796 TaxID=3155640 RepID=UPI0034107F75